MKEDKIKFYERVYYQNYEPVPFETRFGYVLNIYPVLVKEWDLFNDNVQILKQDKSKTNDVEIIKMSYLEFLYNLISAESIRGDDTTCRDMLFESLNAVFKDEKHVTYSFRYINDRVNLCISDEGGVVKCQITPKEFNDIIDIIMTYNYIDYDDRRFSDDVLKAISDYQKLHSKGIGTPTFEEKRAYVIAKTGMDYKQINEMPYRLFSLIFNYNVGVDSYIGDKIIQGSYKYEVKQNVLHPLYEPKKDILSEVFGDADAFKNKISEGAKA
jgi:hypothetical protein